MTEAPELGPAGEPPRRRPVGLLILAASVIASAIWWMLMPEREGPAPAPPPAESAPAPEAEAPAAETTPSSRPAGAPRTPAPAPPAAPTAPEPPPPPAPAPLLRVTGDVEGADVFVDRTFVGKTPFETRDVTPGRHQVQISAAGYDGVSRSVEVAPEGPTEVTFELKKVALDAAVDVVHKHRIGSCEGRLTASLSGLRYAAKDGDDTFQLPFGRLETFTLNYLEKNLQVKVRGGRTWNFTTKAANADALLGFHREVEKARKKLAGGA